MRRVAQTHTHTHTRGATRSKPTTPNTHQSRFCGTEGTFRRGWEHESSSSKETTEFDEFLERLKSLCQHIDKRGAVFCVIHMKEACLQRVVPSGRLPNPDLIGIGTIRIAPKHSSSGFTSSASSPPLTCCQIMIQEQIQKKDRCRGLWGLTF